jgi:hypothetical protein
MLAMRVAYVGLGKLDWPSSLREILRLDVCSCVWVNRINLTVCRGFIFVHIPLIRVSFSPIPFSCVCLCQGGVADAFFQLECSVD